MKNAKTVNSFSCSSWVLGQTSAMLGAVLSLIWGFGLVLIVAQLDYERAHGSLLAASSMWHPPYGPPLVGLGVAALGWLCAHVRNLKVPVPVIVGVGLNLLALVFAMIAAIY